MKIYIASSWKNQHGVEMLTALLRARGHEVISWVENCSKEQQPDFIFEKWVHTPEADNCFKFDTDGATKSDLFIYFAPSGQDAAAEMGAAWASKVRIIALYAKGESLGLMRKMVSKWCNRFTDVMDEVERIEQDADYQKTLARS